MNRVDLATRLSFAASGTAVGLVTNGVTFFLLIYYSQVLGLSPARAGLAMMIALVFDAISDPMVGGWSDALRSRWGRRHPFLYVAIVPVAVTYYALWDPPELSETQLFLYLVFAAVSLRLCLTVHLVPFTALVPELTSAYDERTRLLSYSYASSWFFGTLMAVTMYAYWLADSPEYPDGSGILRAEGYVEAGLFTAVVVLLCLVFSTVGTHHHIPHLISPKRRAGGLRRTASDLEQTLRDRSFLALLLSGICSAAATGTSTALWAYVQPYYWGFDSIQISAILGSQLLSALLAFAVTPRLTRGRDKRPVLVWLSAGAIVFGAGPIFLRLAGAFPANDHPALYPVMLVAGVLQVALIVTSGTVGASMLADVVEARELESGRRDEGLLFSVQSFIAKVSSGVGAWAGGVILALIEFPAETGTAALPAEVVDRLGWVYGPVLTGFYALSILALRLYRIDRRTHAENLRRLGRPGVRGAVLEPGDGFE